MGKDRLPRYAGSPTIRPRYEESGRRMWAHATPPGLRPRRTPVRLTPVVFFRVLRLSRDRNEWSGDGRNALTRACGVMCPITILSLLGGETFRPKVADIHTQHGGNPVTHVWTLREAPYDVRHVEGAAGDSLRFQLLGDVRVREPALHDQESRPRAARCPASSLRDWLLF